MKNSFGLIKPVNKCCLRYLQSLKYSTKNRRNESMIADEFSNLVGVSSIRGVRQFNEDRYSFCKLNDSINFFGLYDGYGGSDCSEFLCNEFSSELKKNLNQNKESDVDLYVALQKTIHNCSYEFNKLNRKTINIRNKPFGSTLLVILLKNWIDLTIANIGDTRAMLMEDNSNKFLTRIHTPADPTEFSRLSNYEAQVIEDLDGKLRVNGILAISRAFGDDKLKEFGVIPKADIISRKICKNDKLILATDGIWDVLSSKRVMEIVNSSKDPFIAAKNLTSEAELSGSQDNCTALVINFENSN